MTRFVSPARSVPAGNRRRTNGEFRATEFARSTSLWVALAASATMLLSLIIILQNGQPSDVHFLGAHGQLPTGIALLIATAFGVLLVAVPVLVYTRVPATHRRIASRTPPPSDTQVANDDTQDRTA
ncbi:hypothetical protein V1634_28085 [Plantactinospora veratri]|uniref:Lipopolysaccharide assembly protein A domain-containing protein n=1 Tax=Plantactinospora veratri TaxID=1436122 RepID=A0ABU7SL92_9ACTN